MSVMADKPSTPTQQQVPQQWNNYNMNLYNMYQNPYMYQTGYGAQNYYQYYAGAYVAQQQQQDNNAFRGFTPSGHLTPFQQNSQNQNTIQQTFQQESQEQHKVITSESSDNDLPPLPPGPPPPQQNGYIHSSSQSTTPKQIEQPPRMYSPSTVAGGTGAVPIRFNMNNQRPRMNFVASNPFNQTPIRPQGNKKNKKKKKKQQQQLQQHLQQQQQQQVQQQTSTQSLPPLPATPPPLPPPPPPPPPPPSEQQSQQIQHQTIQENTLNTNLSIPPPILLKQPPLLATPLVNSYQQQQQKQLDKQQNPPTEQHQAIRTLEEWPPSLRDYVNRCYSKCVTQMDKDRVGVILKGKLMRATNDGTLWIKDWAAEPLPLLESDSKAQMNLKEKLSKLALRLGPIQKSPSPPKKERRGRTKRSYKSDSSSSESTDSETYREKSNSPRNRDQNKNRNNRNVVKKSQKQKRNHTYKHDIENSHFYSEYGMIGSHVQAKKEVLDKRAARFSTGGLNTISSNIGGNISTSPIGNNSSIGLKKKTSSPLYVIDHGPIHSSSVQSSVVGGNQSNASGNNMGDWETMDLHIVGTSEELEKPYLRLTSAPEASQVRPKEVLIKSLDMVKGKWKENRDYHYCCEQLKSIRQDLTVQGIRDDFSVEVYETHGRIALEKGDHAEFNQCQSQLRILHTEVKPSPNRTEFVAYRLLYYIFTKEFLDLSSLVSCLTEEDKKDECISHAVSVVKAWLIGSYHKIFKLYQTAPRMSSYLMDLFMLRERTFALKVIVKAYRPSVPIDFIRDELAFEADSETQEFLTRFGLAFTDETRTKIDCKASTALLNAPPS